MSLTSNSRRKFLKEIGLTTTLLYINPFDLLSNSGLVMLNVQASQQDYNSFLRQFYNFTSLDEMSEADIFKQYDGLLTILVKSAEPGFQKYSEEKKIRTLKSTKPFANDEELKKKQIKELYSAVYTSMIVTGAIVLIVRNKTLLLASLSGTALKVPSWMQKLGSFIDYSTKIYGGGKLIGSLATDSAIVVNEAVKTNVYDKFSASGKLQFKSSFPEIKTKVNDDPLTAAEAFDESKIKNPAVKNLAAFCRQELGNPNIFSDKATADQFLSKYAEKTGDIVSQKVATLLELQKQSNEEALIKEKNESALFQSIQLFIGDAIVSRFAAPKEAAIINQAIGAGITFALGMMTGPGWIAVGINMATTILNKPGGGFEKALFAALKEIQKQLNLISDKLDIVHENQLITIKQLNLIIDQIQSVDEYIRFKLPAIDLKLDQLYDTQNVQAKQTIVNEFNSLNRRIETAINGNDQKEVMSLIGELSDIALDKLDDVTITKYSPGDFSSDVFVSQIFFDKKFKYNISLYDSIGWISGLFAYNPANSTAKVDRAVVHPPEFYAVTSAIINWLMLSNIKKAEQLKLANNLLEYAQESLKVLNDCADRDNIESKIKLYSVTANVFISDLRIRAKELIKNDLTDKNNLLRKFLLVTPTNIDLSTFSDESMKSANDAVQFYVDRNDSALFNLCVDLELLEQKLQSKSDFQGKVRVRHYAKDRPNFQIFTNGFIAGAKSMVLKIKNAKVDFSSSKTIDLDITYKRNLKIAAFKDKTENCQSSGSYGSAMVCETERKVTSLTAETVIDSDWKSALKAAMAAKQMNVAEIFPSIESMSLDDFLKHLIQIKFRSIKRQHVEKILPFIRDGKYRSIDGLGTSIMVQTKLNQLVTNAELVPYIIDYNEEIYTRDDICELLEFTVSTDFDKEGSELLESYRKAFNSFELEKDESPFHFQIGLDSFSERLDPFDFTDFYIILINRQFKDTIKRNQARIKNIQLDSGEPFLVDSIARIKWFIDKSNNG